MATSLKFISHLQQQNLLSSVELHYLQCLSERRDNVVCIVGSGSGLFNQVFRCWHGFVFCMTFFACLILFNLITCFVQLMAALEVFSYSGKDEELLGMFSWSSMVRVNINMVKYVIHIDCEQFIAVLYSFCMNTDTMVRLGHRWHSSDSARDSDGSMSDLFFNENTHDIWKLLQQVCLTVSLCCCRVVSLSCYLVLLLSFCCFSMKSHMEIIPTDLWLMSDFIFQIFISDSKFKFIFSNCYFRFRIQIHFSNCYFRLQIHIHISDSFWNSILLFIFIYISCLFSDWCQRLAERNSRTRRHWCRMWKVPSK